MQTATFTIRLRRYFRLRPALYWCLISLCLLLSTLISVRWSNAVDFDDFIDLNQFEMIDVRVPDVNTRPDIAVNTTDRENVVKEEKQEFGNEDEFRDTGNTAVAPQPRFSCLPAYPHAMRKAGIEGVVIIELGINSRGKIAYGKIVQSLGREFDRVVIEWAKRITFWPALDPDRKPINCRIRLPIRFKLEN